MSDQTQFVKFIQFYPIIKSLSQNSEVTKYDKTPEKPGRYNGWNVSITGLNNKV